MSKSTKISEALKYHQQGQPGKIEVVPTKPMSSQRDLALAYSPGVAEPCLAIAENEDDVYKYTAKGNLVAVISNGTAVLGLGDIGAAASKPVMEGKGVLFKKFAGIDVFDIEIDEKDPDKFIQIVKSLEPTFGGINLEDIKAPESFKIETELREKMNIPVMHDDQHGTAIISAAALLNALELVNKDISKVSIVVNGAGAAAVSCTKLYVSLGANLDNIVMLDSKGVIRKDRENLSASKAEFATKKDIVTLDDAIEQADVFVGLSTGDVLAPSMLLKMAQDPIVFALANPNPEIEYDLALSTRKDVVMATGRSDHPNQVNNVLGFPFIFRGALDVRATEINEHMKLATVKALAHLAKEPVPEVVKKAYNNEDLSFGKDYLIPKPLDTRLITVICPAVAKAAVESGVAKYPISDWVAYEYELQKRIGIDQRLITLLFQRAQQKPKKVVFAEADNYKILKAAHLAQEEGLCKPILLGRVDKIKGLIEEHSLDLSSCKIIDPSTEAECRARYGDVLYKKRQRKGINVEQARKLMQKRNYFGSMMVELGEADALISGLTRDYPTTILPALQIIGTEEGVNRVAGMYLMLTKKEPMLFADTTVNIDPSVDDLIDITKLTAKHAQIFDIEPRIAMLSYSNFGSSRGASASKASKAAAILKDKFPELLIEGEMQANVAVNPSLQKELYPFSKLADKGANTLIFPNLESGNIAYKMMMELGSTEAIGPILMGMKKPVHVLQMGSSVREILNMVAIAVVDAQITEKNSK